MSWPDRANRHATAISGHKIPPSRNQAYSLNGRASNSNRANTVPWSIANASFKRQERNEGVTEIVEMKDRGHALVIDSGWQEVADTALKFVQRFV